MAPSQAAKTVGLCHKWLFIPHEWPIENCRVIMLLNDGYPVDQKKNRSSKWGSGYNGHVYFTCRGYFILLESSGGPLVGCKKDSVRVPRAIFFAKHQLTGWWNQSQNQPKSARTDRCVLLKNRRALAHLFKQLVFWCEDQFLHQIFLLYPFASAGIEFLFPL